MSTERRASTRFRASVAAGWVWLVAAWLAVSGRVRRARDADGAAETGMHKLFDLHALSIGGDALVAIGLAGTIFFNVPVGEARARVALYLLVTMAPFALLAPLVGPVLDRFRHGRRYALATTMLARAFLAYAIAADFDPIVLYPAAFGILVLGRAYGVARAAAVPRVLPEQMSLVEANARSSLYGTVAGGLIGAVGVGLSFIGPEWTLRLGTAVYLVGMVLALRLPAKADSDPPETVPRAFAWLAHRDTLRLWDTHIWAAITASGGLRALYGFLTVFFAFRTRTDALIVSAPIALGMVIGALGIGSLVATAIGTRLRLRRPLLLDVMVLGVTALACLVGAVGYSLPAAVALALVAALSSGLAKLAVDAQIQSRLPDHSLAVGFAHSETMLQLAWVAGAAVGLIPFSGPWGLFVAAIGMAAAAARVGSWIWMLRQRSADLRTVGVT
ncbi:MAG TPA: MFS transporter [Cryptosporangiaceae bacterium]|nr:MFS transporter [Cryptosporangiaceae bacterium]